MQQHLVEPIVFSLVGLLIVLFIVFSLFLSRLTKKGRLSKADAKTLRQASFFAAALFILFAIFASDFILKTYYRHKLNSAFEGKLQEYVLLASVVPNQTTLKSAKFIKGNLLFIDTDTNKVADVTFANGLRVPIARNPESLDTVVLVKYYNTHVGTYTSGARGFRVDCLVKVLDLRKRLIVDEHTFEGMRPPETKTDRADAFGEKPIVPILNYIEDHKI